MIDKRSLHHFWTHIRPVRAWYLAAAFVALLVVHMAALRSNYVTMTHYRDAVYQADKDGGNVELALQQLRAYVGGHMNANLDNGNGVYPPIQLKYTYERLVAAEQKRVDDINSKVYTDAQHHCEALYPGSFSGGPRVPCISAYIKDNGASVHKIPDALYKFDFITPSWSPDAAGWSRVFCALSLVLLLLRLVLGRVLPRLTK